MSSKDGSKSLIPECPKLKKIYKTKANRKPSFINLIEADDDSDSGSYQNNSLSSKEKNKKDELNKSDDRYEDSFDEEFYEQFGTNPTSADIKVNKSKK